MCGTALASAQDAPKLDNAQLDQLMAPVALYPDAVLSQLLMASTYPDDVKEAADWSKRNPSQSGDAAVKAVENEPWDPSVKSLLAFPSVMDMAGREPQWVVQMGNAFLDQPNDVMDSVQRLRSQAQAAGSLKSNEQQTVTVQSQGPQQIIQIEPANPQVVYVPQYNPTVVYGAWAYPAYPPYYYPPLPGSVFATSLVAGIGWGLGVAAVNSMWGGFNWGRGDVNINVNRYNNINVNNRLSANQTNFQHNAARRGSTPYNSASNRNRFDAQRQSGLANRDRGGGNLAGGRGAAPGGRDAARDRAAQSFQSRTGQSIPGHRVDGGGRMAQGGAAQNRSGQGAAGNRVGQGGGQARESAASRQNRDRASAQARSRAANHDNAFRDAGNGAKVRQQAQRGNIQHASAQRGGANRSFSGGGGARMGGGARAGGGGHMGGGRRR
ncbi:DUF3300 domain-containing protein [Variovorax dokdonensis]|uniref:DUF3300 domain-containing protein n=2 Tax=Variovorax dokdonensis TaxID=344883 RepID=A0ABT7N911_9BURK|nr:DUF3300 domain-containing protein [Variovorax dokdonensis]MDM0044360.1 DUF3300 domain-containing protein [Variovorax dokdonensis]